MATHHSTPRADEPDPRDVGQGTQALLSALNVGFRILRYLLVVMLLGYLFSGFFILDSHEEAYVLQFGRIAGAEGEQVRRSGSWHIALPKYITEIVRVPTGEVQVLTTNHFWNVEPDRNVLTNPDEHQEMPPEGQGLNPGVAAEGYLLTANSNILHARWQLTYFITDPIKYTTRYADSRAVIKSTLENVILKQMASVNIEDALYAGSSGLTTSIKEQVMIALNALDIGVEVSSEGPGLVFLDKRPPRAAQPAFNLVLEADQQHSEMIEAARAVENRIIADARSRQQRLIIDATAYSTNLTTKASADADYFTSIQDQVKLLKGDARSLILTLYVDTLLYVLEKVESKYVAYPSDELRLHIGPRRHSPNTPEREGQGY